MNRSLRIMVLFGVFFSGFGFACAQDYTFRELAETEAGYILKCQFIDETSQANGAINDIYGSPTWVVPRENAMAILGLLMAGEVLENDTFRAKAQLSADYLVKVQDKDGAWYNQYNYTTPGTGKAEDKEALAKSPTQTAEVLIAFYKLGFDPGRYLAMKKGAMYLMSCQKHGGDGFLLGAGKDSEGNYRVWRWATDNSYAYQALKAAEVWALNSNDYRFALSCAAASRKILKGINSTLYIKNPYDPDFGVWRRVVDGTNQQVDPQNHDWINYAPQMLNVPCLGVGRARVGKWIHDKFQKSDGACVWDDYANTDRESPGFSFQAVLSWRSLSQSEFYLPALNWALASGLWQVDLDDNGVAGGWIDWIEAQAKQPAEWWNRFIDTSFYSIAAYNGGYDFSIVPSWLRIGYADPKQNADTIPCYLKLKLEFPREGE
ncbi:MAG: hypothetical protein NTY14_01200 [Candidatus Omnitrophica bacterium]|nr:hypothetical protein [Candidatus Omnitrophota bacterium]